MKSDEVENDMTFATSIYEDGSIRTSYMTNVVASDEDYFGLWGSFVSTVPSYLRYHSEQSNNIGLVSGTDTIFCPLNVSACVQEACVRLWDQNLRSIMSVIGMEYLQVMPRFQSILLPRKSPESSLVWFQSWMLQRAQSCQ